MALAAELNVYPGPRHVLDMAPMLSLTEEQRTRVQAVFDEMQEEARVLGKELVELERKLDRAFATDAVTEEGLAELMESIGMARASLRFTHLRAHLRTLPLLTDAQRQRYQQARGYGAATAPGKGGAPA
jgi:Spy/CpxP family protein refolding chaperone